MNSRKLVDLASVCKDWLVGGFSLGFLASTSKI
jgi:hypothetical protein